MPEVLCGLTCYSEPSSLTAGATAREFLASLNPALESPGCAVEVYRLERLAPEATIASDDVVVCCVPGWHFDFAALEELHRNYEELRIGHEALQLQYDRTKEALMSLNSSLEVSEASPQAIDVAPVAAPAASGEALSPAADALLCSAGTGGCPPGGRRREKAPATSAEAQLRQQLADMRQQLTDKDKKHQETKATVIALRSEFMQLVHMMQFSGCHYQGLEIPSVMKELDTNVKTSLAQETVRSPNNAGWYDAEKVGDCAAPRHVSQPPPATTIVASVRRPAGSPRAAQRAAAAGSDGGMCDTLRAQQRAAAPVPFSTPRSMSGRRRGQPQQRGVAHSAGASVRRPDTGGI